MPYIKYMGEPINGTVNVKCVYYMPTKRRCDVVNMLEATLDILVKYGVLADDNSNIVVSMDGSRVLYDKENPRTEVEITPIEC
jgi:Holliday junction resolvase RusA-like endonuclease